MSSTEIYYFNKDGNAEDLGQVRNSWRGAMAIWNILDDKYLPPFVPEWAKILGKTEDKYHRSSDMVGNALKEVWALYNSDNISEIDKIVLGSTFDYVVVKKENIDKLLDAFEKFEGETSLKEQSKLIRDSIDENTMAIGWNQTSVNGDTWVNYGGYDEKKDIYLPYNLNSMDKHWYLFDKD